jgi:phospholipase C
VIQFIEKRFGVIETHITPWRRAISGDLTAALNFKFANPVPPKLPDTDNFISFVSQGALVPVTQAMIEAGKQPAPNITTVVPAAQTMPTQEPGSRLARALPYRLQAHASADTGAQSVSIEFENTGAVGAFFHVRTAEGAKNSGQGTGPWGYTVDPAARVLSDRWIPTGGSGYDLSVYGPNGFFRRFAGGLSQTSANLSISAVIDVAALAIVLLIGNVAKTQTTVTIANEYSGNQEHVPLSPGGRVTVPVPIVASFQWYDVVITVSTDASFVRHYAGHIETGFDSVSDPHIGASA